MRNIFFMLFFPVFYFSQCTKIDTTFIGNSIMNNSQIIFSLRTSNKDIKTIDFQATQMDLTIDLVDGSGINMNQQTKNNVVNFVFDGALPPGTDTQNGLIIQNGTSILNSNGIPVRPTPEQEKANNKILPL